MKAIERMLNKREKLLKQIEELRAKNKENNDAIVSAMYRKLVAELGDKELRFNPASFRKNENCLFMQLDGLRINGEDIQVCDYHNAQKRIGNRYEWTDSWVNYSWRLSSKGLVDLYLYTKKQYAHAVLKDRSNNDDEQKCCPVM